MPRKKGPPAQPLHAKLPADRYAVVQVAATLKVRYQRARDLMLSGRFGETAWEGRTMHVAKAPVDALAKQLDEAKEADAKRRRKRA